MREPDATAVSSNERRDAVDDAAGADNPHARGMRYALDRLVEVDDLERRDADEVARTPSEHRGICVGDGSERELMVEDDERAVEIPSRHGGTSPGVGEAGPGPGPVRVGPSLDIRIGASEQPSRNQKPAKSGKFRRRVKARQGSARLGVARYGASWRVTAHLDGPAGVR